MSDVYFFPVFRLGACVSADAATDFTAFDDFGLLNSFDALDATFLDVCSFDFLVTMGDSFCGALGSTHRIDGKGGAHLSDLSVHRHHTGRRQSPSPVNHEALVRPFHMVVGRGFAKGLVRQVHRSLKEGLCNVLVHSRMLRRGLALVYSHFPILVVFVHGVTVGRAAPGRNTEIQLFQG